MEKFDPQQVKDLCFPWAVPRELPGMGYLQRNLPKRVSCQRSDDISRKRLGFRPSYPELF